MTTTHLLDEIKKLKSIADVGLLYCSNEYDRERYLDIRNMSYRMLSGLSGHAMEELELTFPIAKDYPTAKVDIRGLVLSPDRKILLVKESADGRWSLPGGWADVGYSPAETVVKEVKEETGLEVKAERLLAVFDKRKHAHPPEPFYVYKLFFYCTVTASEIKKGFDVLDVQYFSIDNLPPLSEVRILKSQLELVYQKVISTDHETYFE